MAVLKTIAKLMPAGLRSFLKAKMEESANAKVIAEWKQAGSPLPPPSVVKRKIIADLQNKHKFVFFVETGTYLGDTVNAQKNNFEKYILLNWVSIFIMLRLKDLKRTNILKFCRATAARY